MAPTMSTAQNWRLEHDADGIAWLIFDRAGTSTNTLSAAVLEELSGILGKLAAEPPKGLVIRSGKDNGFIAGADIDDFERVKTVDDAVAIVKRGWDVFNQLAAAPFPTLALVRGFCLGGGLELALACRIASSSMSPARGWGCPKSCWVSSPAGAVFAACRGWPAHRRPSTCC
jgi:3-hydroxyacyl-CoA dehydrogenase/enoyl-CoA hydratase/3-hydroxybutyryl-CoA epimerase